VIECRTGPIRRRVAEGTVCWKTGRHVIWIGRLVKRLQMTARTGRAQSRVLVIHVACGTRNGCVPAGERESGCRVIKDRARPVRRRVAQRTVPREARSGVVRIRGCLIFGQMAGVAFCA